MYLSASTAIEEESCAAFIFLHHPVENCYPDGAADLWDDVGKPCFNTSNGAIRTMRPSKVANDKTQQYLINLNAVMGRTNTPRIDETRLSKPSALYNELTKKPSALVLRFGPVTIAGTYRENFVNVFPSLEEM